MHLAKYNLLLEPQPEGTLHIIQKFYHYNENSDAFELLKLSPILNTLKNEVDIPSKDKFIIEFVKELCSMAGGLVMGHIGLTSQRWNSLDGFKVHGNIGPVDTIEIYKISKNLQEVSSWYILLETISQKSPIVYPYSFNYTYHLVWSEK